jgi:hypothetical protein
VQFQPAIAADEFTAREFAAGSFAGIAESKSEALRKQDAFQNAGALEKDDFRRGSLSPKQPTK